jgi:hypothetical protein
MQTINWLAVLTAAVSIFLLGGLWYSPALFGNTWQRLSGAPPKEQGGHPGKVFGVAFVFALLAAFVYAWLMPPAADAVSALEQGLLVGFGFAATSFGINYQFGTRPTALWLIDGGYHTLQFGIYGLIIGLWR